MVGGCSCSPSPSATQRRSGPRAWSARRGSAVACAGPGLGVASKRWAGLSSRGERIVLTCLKVTGLRFRTRIASAAGELREETLELVARPQRLLQVFRRRGR